MDSMIAYIHLLLSLVVIGQIVTIVLFVLDVRKRSQYPLGEDDGRHNNEEPAYGWTNIEKFEEWVMQRDPDLWSDKEVQ